MNQRLASEQVLSWEREEQITVPSPARERRIAIRYRDWERLKRRLSQVTYPISKLSIVYSVLFGVAASSGLSIIPIMESWGLLSWMTSFYVCVFVSSLLNGCVLFWFDCGVRSQRRSELLEIKNEMKEIEDVFEMEKMEHIDLQLHP